jgi:hypothetical protein
MAHIREYQDWVPPPRFNAEHINKLQELEWLIVQCNISAPGYYRGSPEWTATYNWSDFARAERRLFGADNYDFFIGSIQTLSGNCHKLDTQDFEVQNQSLKSN